MARDIALAHHERWDGKGYPFGLQGDQIPLPARIVALADYYDALTSKRVYKLAMSHDEARKIILDESGLQFDPEVVQAFLESEEGFRQISRDLAQRRDGSSAYLPPLLPPFDARSAPRSDWSADLARQAVAFAHRLAADVAGQVEQEVHRAEKVEAEINRLIALWDGDDQLPSVATRVLENNNLLRRQLAATAARLDCEAHDLEDRLVEAQRDTVTGLIQRRQFEQELSNRSSQWNSRATCYGLLLIAIDKLQQVEAYTGSEKMDEILLAGARFLGTLTRETDLVACYQRGVYAVALPGVSLDNAAKVAERIRAALEAARLATEEEELALTVSIGLTETAPGASVATIIRQAEAALQEAQRLGGNACVCWQGEVAVGGGGGW
jgi:diguanylate cyclase (GGDEF)-like protein